jgi:hypothetical protein
MSFYTWGNSVWNSKEVIRISGAGRLELEQQHQHIMKDYLYNQEVDY